MLPQITHSTTLLEFFRQLTTSCPWLDGKFVDCTFTIAGPATDYFPHGLGRPWRGAWIVGNSAPSTAFAQVGLPTAAGARMDAVEASILVPGDVTIRAWVY